MISVYERYEMMKKLLSVILAAVMLAGASAFALPASAEGEGGGLIETVRPEMNVVSPLAVVQSVSGPDAYRDALSGEGAPPIILVNGDEVSDFGELFTLCAAAPSVPNVRITDAEQADSILAAADALGFDDITVISPDASLLARIREGRSVIRTGLEVTLPGDAITSKEANGIRLAVRGAPATFCVIGPEHATLRNVRELQALALAVWIKLDPADPAAVAAAVNSGANGLITDDRQSAISTINEFFEPGTLARTPLIIGHRGYPAIEPDNTIESFRAALDNGADIFEIDVHISADGHVIVMHDGDIRGMTNYAGDLSIEQMTLEEIKSYNIVSSVYSPGKYRIGDITDLKVPTFDEVLDLLAEYPERRVFVELKGENPATVAEASRLIRERGMEDQVDVISFSGYLLGETVAEGNMPGMSTGFLGGASGAEGIVAEVLRDLFNGIAAAQRVMSTINYSSIHDREYFAAANDRGMTVWPWTYNTFSNDRAFFMGSGGITTDDPGWAADMFKFITSEPVEVGLGKKVDAPVSGTTYKDEKIGIAPYKIRMKVISGDAAEVENGRIIGARVGTSQVVCSVTALTADGSEYVLSCGPVTVTVTENGPGVGRETHDVDVYDPVPAVWDGDVVYVSHLNANNETYYDAMIVTDTGWAHSVGDIDDVNPGVIKHYVMYEVENRDGKYIATKYVKGTGLFSYRAPDPKDGFLLFLCRRNRSYEMALGGKLLGRELIPDGFLLYKDFAIDSEKDPEHVKKLEVHRVENASGFSDVKDSAFYADPVVWAVYMGITSGTGKTAFSPGDPCTRAQAVTFLWRAAGSPAPSSDENPFEDVTESKYYYDAVLWAVEQGVTNGTDATHFSPDTPCTRGQIVTFLRRSAGSPEPQSEANPFADVKDGAFYRDAVLWAVENGVTKGTDATHFSPNDNCTRGQIVTFLYRNAK